RQSAAPPWFIGAAVTTIFVEGSVHERRERDGGGDKPAVEQAILAHPMVQFYGCPPAAMRLVRAHRAVEGDRPKGARDMRRRHVPLEGSDADAVVAAVGEAHRAWLAYRDGVARAMGLERS